MSGINNPSNTDEVEPYDHSFRSSTNHVLQNQAYFEYDTNTDSKSVVLLTVPFDRTTSLDLSFEVTIGRLYRNSIKVLIDNYMYGTVQAAYQPRVTLLAPPEEGGLVVRFIKGNAGINYIAIVLPDAATYNRYITIGIAELGLGLGGNSANALNNRKNWSHQVLDISELLALTDTEQVITPVQLQAYPNKHEIISLHHKNQSGGKVYLSEKSWIRTQYRPAGQTANTWFGVVAVSGAARIVEAGFLVGTTASAHTGTGVTAFGRINSGNVEAYIGTADTGLFWAIGVDG